MGSVLAASEFDPNGNYYVSAVTALDTHKIRVQSTNSSSTLANAFSLDKGHKLTSVSWGNYATAGSSAGAKRKKRRQSNSFSIENQFLAVGLNKGSILIYSPLTNEVISKLENPNASAINDFHYSSITQSGWSVDLGQDIVEWDLITYKPKRHFQFQDQINLIRVIEYQGKPHLLLASHTIQLLDLETKEIIKTYPGHISPIHTLLTNNSDFFITAAEGDRYINIYPLDGTPTVLVTQSSIISVSYGNNTVSAVTEDGIVEVFNNPLTQDQPVKNKRRGQQSKQSNGKIELKRSTTDQQLKIEHCYINENSIIITWLEDANIPYFETIPLQDINELKTIKKDKPAIQAKDHTLFGQDIATAKQYNEANAIVTTGDNLRFLNNKETQDQDLPEDDQEEDGPTLAEKLESLKVQQPIKKKQGRATAGSLTVVLTQALKANDHALLETVLANKDETVLKNTVQRLDTTLAVILLERLAERIARQTHRQGQLNIWVKWVMAIHGGYLINIPNLTKSLSSLHSTLIKRSSTLPRLLELQGRLDVLYSQQELKQLTQDQIDDEFHDDDDESDVEYVEELEDAGLIDDGEQDFYEQDEDGFMSIDESSDDEDEDEDEPKADKLSDGELDDEEGFSDVEVNGVQIESESESEDEQSQLKARIAKLRAKQQKRK
ncbi:WD repeat-containing protein [Wickerhamomyces ciferrii]|uniref:WD repeat-containing protein n=1 Tax=Wickerhamomyces ciferrii (strain ATCC 14091 / BCRC 22168 / CBS 111 / JCM 3599 / NBRC 0793 / NRRL Y-1031 F-60-10) TaxID=1206466 RepID=K0KQS8_WICCF|nr:WD repeat-containing protein [Wickerhamomyces ciferrii]CCH43684.1 WD repeat-containing protein [Wickerhamomyces ciferrii]